MSYSNRLAAYALATAAALTATLSGLDFLFTREPITFADVATDFVEMLVLSVAMVISAMVVGRLRGLETQTSNMRRELSDAAEAGRAWRAQSEHLLKGLSEAVSRQFDTWGLTDAEAEIAMLILKGASLKEIATLREKSEGTIRQQAQSVYRKSGLNNRSELSAFFLEDLFDVAAVKSSIINSPTVKH